MTGLRTNLMKTYVFSDLIRMTNDFWTCQFGVRSTMEHTLYINGLKMDFFREKILNDYKE